MFDFATYLGERRGTINRALDAAMPAEDTRPAVLHTAMRYGVFPGGKRLRPVLCLAACDAVLGDAAGGGRDPERSPALQPALAVELLHTYTLIHDDLPCMDDDAMRRGKPTVHVEFGEAMAVLAGDALQALAFETVARSLPHPGHPPGQTILELARAAGSQGVVGGQVEDIHWASRTPDRDAVRFVHVHKTADLFCAAIRMGALAGGAAQTDLEALTRFARGMGIAFQITDDLLDHDASAPGPSPHELSCLAVCTPAEARTEAEELVADAIAAIGSLPGWTEPLQAIARHCVTRTG